MSVTPEAAHAMNAAQKRPRPSSHRKGPSEEDASLTEQNAEITARQVERMDLQNEGLRHENEFNARQNDMNRRAKHQHGKGRSGRSRSISAGRSRGSDAPITSAAHNAPLTIGGGRASAMQAPVGIGQSAQVVQPTRQPAGGGGIDAWKAMNPSQPKTPPGRILFSNSATGPYNPTPGRVLGEHDSNVASDLMAQSDPRYAAERERENARDRSVVSQGGDRRTVAVDPRHAGPGQLTSDLEHGPNGPQFAKKPGTPDLPSEDQRYANQRTTSAGGTMDTGVETNPNFVQPTYPGNFTAANPETPMPEAPAFDAVAAASGMAATGSTSPNPVATTSTFNAHNQTHVHSVPRTVSEGGVNRTVTSQVASRTPEGAKNMIKVKEPPPPTAGDFQAKAMFGQDNWLFGSVNKWEDPFFGDVGRALGSAASAVKSYWKKGLVHQTPKPQKRNQQATSPVQPVLAVK